jgi:hypothetical protein
VTRRVPVLEDRDAFLRYVLKTKSWDLLPSGMCAEAVELRWADKRRVPGVGVLVAKRVSLTKK